MATELNIQCPHCFKLVQVKTSRLYTTVECPSCHLACNLYTETKSPNLQRLLTRAQQIRQERALEELKDASFTRMVVSGAICTVTIVLVAFAIYRKEMNERSASAENTASVAVSKEPARVPASDANSWERDNESFLKIRDQQALARINSNDQPGALSLYKEIQARIGSRQLKSPQLQALAARAAENVLALDDSKRFVISTPAPAAQPVPPPRPAAPPMSPVAKSWEEENAQRIERQYALANDFRTGGHLDDALASYEEIGALIGKRKLNTPRLIQIASEVKVYSNELRADLKSLADEKRAALAQRKLTNAAPRKEEARPAVIKAPVAPPVTSRTLPQVLSSFDFSKVSLEREEDIRRAQAFWDKSKSDPGSIVNRNNEVVLWWLTGNMVEADAGIRGLSQISADPGIALNHAVITGQTHFTSVEPGKIIRAQRVLNDPNANKSDLTDISGNKELSDRIRAKASCRLGLLEAADCVKGKKFTGLMEMYFQQAADLDPNGSIGKMSEENLRRFKYWDAMVR